MIHVVFEAQDCNKSEVKFWQAYLLPAGCKIHCSDGNRNMPDTLDRLSKQVTKSDIVLVVFDLVNQYLYKNGLVIMHKETMSLLNSVKVNMRKFQCKVYFCNEYSFEALVLKTKLYYDFICMLSQAKKYYIQWLPLLPYANIIDFKYLEFLYRQPSLTGGTPEQRLSSLLALSSGTSGFKINKSIVGNCWVTNCLSCYYPSKSGCPFLLQSFDNKKQIFLQSLGILSFYDLFVLFKY